MGIHEGVDWRGIRDNVLTVLHSGEPEVETLLEELEALKLVARITYSGGETNSTIRECQCRNRAPRLDWSVRAPFQSRRQR
jgi:hypothetical protein